MSQLPARISTADHRPARAVRRMERMLSLSDFERAAARHLPLAIYGYLASVAETGASFDANFNAYQSWHFVPRSLVGVRERNIATSIMGQQWKAPFGIAPMGLAALMGYQGDAVLAAAARDAGIPFVLSGSSLTPLEAIREVNPDAWFQAYVPGEHERIDALLDRVAAAGFGTLVVTIDVVIAGNRENNTRNGFTRPLRPTLRLLWQGMTHPRWSLGTFMRTLAQDGMPHFENSMATRGAPILSRHAERDFGKRDHLNWDHIRHIRDRWKGKLVIKGLLAPEDAVTAQEIGAEAIVVSNHGGRQLDGALAPLHALPAIRAACPGLCIGIDGGVRRGSDVLKALALGADFALVGRPLLAAAAVGARAGVDRAIAILNDETRRNLGLLGLNGIQELSSRYLVPAGTPLPAAAATPAPETKAARTTGATRLQ
ncbi:alpha-hydroxy acid oxidase [Alkalilacustris brevis]|uniref:alpha-hydroxy acid oxidase n=1 Tax=Alkalilacustris brevis TaxID=2026338 RepID=UPI000E0D3A92|nr:alpha-hydroxy acid oxidase [Alkalilacustris brevis]